MNNVFLTLCGVLVNKVGGVVYTTGVGHCLVVGARHVQFICLHLSLSSYYSGGILLSIYAQDLFGKHVGLFYTFSMPKYQNVFIYALVDNARGVTSLSGIIPNSEWYEREVSEFFGVKFYGSKDTRNLFLAYHSNVHPLLKDWSCGVANSAILHQNTKNIEY